MVAVLPQTAGAAELWQRTQRAAAMPLTVAGQREPASAALFVAAATSNAESLSADAVPAMPVRPGQAETAVQDSEIAALGSWAAAPALVQRGAFGHKQRRKVGPAARFAVRYFASVGRSRS